MSADFENEPDRGHDIPSTDQLPPVIYAVLAGLVLWLVLASWSFAGAGYSELSLAVISLYFLVLMAIPFVLWLVWRADRDPEAKPAQRQTFSTWASGQFEISQGRRKGATAAVEIILPIAAAAVGMTAFAIVFHYAALHAPVFPHA